MKRATYLDVLDAPENKIAEILDGELFLSPMLAPRVGVVHSALLAIIGNAFDRGDGGPEAPPTERFDRSRKLRIYAEAGVRHTWLVKPSDRTLEVLRLREGLWTIVGQWEDAAVVRAEPFEAIELDLGRLWPDEAPASPGLG
jgi:hypothetical protein